MAWYPLNGNLKDKTGFSGDLSIEGTVNLTIDGKIGGKAPNFIGVASNGLYINNFIQDVENWQSNFSYACWVYINSQEGNWQYLISTGRDCGSYGCNLQIRSSDLVICYETKNQQHYSTGISVPLQVWTHITMTCDDNFIYFYVNGEYKTKVENKGFGYTEAKNQALYIGKMSYNNTVNYFPLNGSIQDVRIYNHCLSDAEVKEISKAKILHYTMSSVYGGSNLVSKTSSWNGDWVDRSETKVDGEILIINRDSQYPKYERIAVKSGEKYTISVDVKGSENNSQEFNLGIIDYLSAENSRITYREAKGYFTNSWERRFWKIIVPNNSNIKYLSFGCRNNIGGNFVGYFKHLKIEKGWVDDPIWIPKETDEDYSKYCLDRKEYDISGNSYYGERVGDISFETNSSKYCSSTYFNGNSYITTQNNKENISKILNTNTFTISTWVYPTNLSDAGLQTIFMCRTPKTTNRTNQVFIAINLNRMMVSYYDDDTSFNYNFALNKWYHIVVSSNSQEISVYINGEPIGTANKSALLLSETAIPTIGADSDRDERYFYGNISDFRIYSTALSDEDILRLYQDREKVDNLGNLYCSELNEVERRVEYLESNGTQYIDTEIKADDTTEVEIIVAATNTGATWDGCLFGSRTSTNSSDSYILWFNHYSNASTPQLSLVYNGVNYGKTVFITNNPNGKHIITFRNKDLYIDNELKTTATSVQPNSTLPLLFLALNTSSGVDSRKFRGKIYSCKIWQNNTLVRDFLPVISTEEGHIGEACLFDTVTNTYFYNQGTGKFTTNLDESTSHIDFTSKGIVNTDYIIEGKDKTKIKNDGNIIEVNNLYEN